MISNGQQTIGEFSATVGDWRLAGEPAAQSGFGFRRRRFPAIQYGAGDRRKAKANVLHIIWVDNGCNMVAIQEEKYQRLSGVEFGPVDFKAYAEAFETRGSRSRAPPPPMSRRCGRRWTSMAPPWSPSRRLQRQPAADGPASSQSTTLSHYRNPAMKSRARDRRRRYR